MATGPNEGDGRFKPRFPGDRATAPTPLEDASEDTWYEFVRLQTSSAGLSSDSSPPERAGQAGAPATLEATMLLARRANRACPKAAAWRRLYELLPRHGADRAPVPITEKDWSRVSPMQKRLLLRDQIEWAAATSSLGAIHAFMLSLGDDDWDYF